MSTPRFPLCLLAAASLCSAGAHADTGIAVMFNDPAGLYGSYYADIERVTLAAGNAWISNFASSFNTELSVSINFASMATANGRSAQAAFLGTGSDGLQLYEQGAAHELRTGIDGNGAAADIEINLGIGGYLQNELWFDPEPGLRLAQVPQNQTDAMSVLLHEFGHAFGFNGWRDGNTGQLPGNYQSTFDALVQPQQGQTGTALFLSGPQSSAVYGGAVPLTQGTYAHLGNGAGGPGNDLVPDLMNGVVFYRGTRYTISALDLAVMQDLGLPMAQALAPVPEPGSLALWLAGLGLLALPLRKAAAAAHSRT